MKLKPALMSATLGLMLGGSAVASATPARAVRAPKAQCTNIACTLDPEPLGIWCRFAPGQKCSMQNPNRCENDNC